tara:strand:- start:174 stop:443 length:270 start_codon:yes stop_codon:yes gene_type:complete
MKVIVWVNKQELIDNKITKVYNTAPISGQSVVQVQMSVDEYIGYVDNEPDLFDDQDTDWKVEQYNRHRSIEDHIDDISELDQDNQPFAD